MTPYAPDSTRRHPLIWEFLTRASLVALPAHALLSLALGIAWLWQAPPSSSAGLTALNNVWPLHNTAVVLVCLGAIEVLMLGLVHNRGAEAAMLIAAALVMFALAGMSAIGHVPGSSWGGVIIWIYIGTVHLASVVSLAYNESRAE